MASMMEGVVLHGTGQNAQISGYHIAGKTGTAKKIIPGGGGYTDHEYYASFGGFGPLRDPRLVAFVVLDTPRGGFYYGGLVAAPVFERIVADALSYLRVPPDDDPWQARRNELKTKAQAQRKSRPAHDKNAHGADDGADTAPALLVTSPGQVPDLRGMSAREAVAGLVARGYRARVDGQGVVVRQTPAAGTALPAGQACALHLGDPATLVEDERRARAEPDGAVAVVAETRPRAPTRRETRKRP
jgi:stage V sporulation protein D (sporulation-specific penicillin-binding protein)